MISERDGRIYNRFPLNIDILFERVLAIVGIATLIWFMVRA